MSKNILDEGVQIPVVLAATVASGKLVLIGSLFGVALTAGNSGDTIALRIGCRTVQPKSTSASTAATLGQKIYWDATNNVVTTTSSGNTYIGVCAVACADADATMVVLLNRAF